MGLAVAILIVAAIFEPLKRRIQSWVDKVFDRHHYDYRKALIEFGRGLSSETISDALLDSIVERLPRTLLVSRVAVFLADDQASATGGSPRAAAGVRRRRRRAQGAGARIPGLRSRRRTTPTSSSRTRSRRCICRRMNAARRLCWT